MIEFPSKSSLNYNCLYKCTRLSILLDATCQEAMSLRLHMSRSLVSWSSIPRGPFSTSLVAKHPVNLDLFWLPSVKLLATLNLYGLPLAKHLIDFNLLRFSLAQYLINLLRFLQFLSVRPTSIHSDFIHCICNLDVKYSSNLPQIGGDYGQRRSGLQVTSCKALGGSGDKAIGWGWLRSSTLRTAKLLKIVLGVRVLEHVMLNATWGH